jgi:hypothetical protein
MVKKRTRKNRKKNRKKSKIFKGGMMNIDFYRHYRLGDFLSGYLYRKDESEYNRHLTQYKGSLVEKYHKELKKNKKILGEFNIKILDNILKKYIYPKFDLYIHLRLGDVLSGINNGKFDFARNYNFQPNKYNLILPILKKKYNINSCKLFYGFHKLKQAKVWGNDPKLSDELRFKNSKKYIEIVKSILKKNNIKVFDQPSGNPDKDFEEMCSCNIFIKSGGGFSNLISKIVKFRGNMVINPFDF